jgi:hypothetical protein
MNCLIFTRSAEALNGELQVAAAVDLRLQVTVCLARRAPASVR